MEVLVCPRQINSEGNPFPSEKTTFKTGASKNLYFKKVHFRKASLKKVHLKKVLFKKSTFLNLSKILNLKKLGNYI